MSSPLPTSQENLDRRREEERIRSEGRLPPGQSLTIKFPVLHYGDVPKFHPSTWDLRVWGQVEERVSWDWEDFNQLPRTQVNMDIHCVTRWSKADTLWEGVSVRTLIEAGLILSLIHISEPTRLGMISYAVFC